VADVSGLAFPVEVDPRKLLPPVLDQLQLGSCTSNATVTAFRWDSILDAADTGDLSRLWIYRGERIIEGTLAQGDVGAMGHDAYLVAQQGIPPETDWPYDIATFNQSPPPAATRDRGHYVLRKPVKAVPRDVASIKAVLANRQLVTFGFTVYESFESQAIASSGVVPMPAHGEKVLGGHEIVAVGYLRSHPHHVLCRNSWGAGWGDQGYLLFPWAYITSHVLADDLRTITRPAGK
jgi:C1A family cysteine protease